MEECQSKGGSGIKAGSGAGNWAYGLSSLSFNNRVWSEMIMVFFRSETFLLARLLLKDVHFSGTSH